MPKIWKEDVTALFEALGINVQKPLVVSFNKATYEFDRALKANWLYYAFLAFLKLASIIKKPECVVTVGAGSGLDGIALYEIFRPQQLVLIDVHPGVVEIARSNLQDYVVRTALDLNWEVRLGNLCDSMPPASSDLIYANIPTIPARPSRVFAGMNSSTFFDPSLAKDSPEEFVQSYLGLQYEFLKKARVSLKIGGSAVVALGVRMPTSTVRELFVSTGFGEAELLVVDLKEQSQPNLVVAAYAKQERNSGVSFDFYREEALASSPDLNLPLSEFKESLKEWRLSAQDALRYSRSGNKVYHVVAILRGKK